MEKKHLFSLRSLPIGKILLLFLLIYIALLAIPYIQHKNVSVSYQKKFAKQSFYSDTAGTERVAYINDNTDALLYRLHMLDEAKDEIILSTFDFNADKSGQDMMASLLHAADRGVSVRIYNPINLLKPWNLQARMHDKYVIVDQKMYLLGGRNTTNLFLGDYSRSKNIDRELFVYETAENDSSSIRQLTDYFESVWALSDSKEYTCKKMTKKIQSCKAKLENRYTSLKEKYPDAYSTWDYEALTLQTNKVSLLSNPIKSENKEPWMWYSLHQLMMQGEQVRIYTPYIICGKEMYQDLTELHEKNIPVEIITNDVASGANPWGCTDYLNQKKNIWETGARVYEFMGAHSCHTKAVLIDDRMSIVGSYNMDMRSTYQDTELMLAVDCPELNSIIQTEMERDKTYSKTMGNDGEYDYGENYHSKDLSFGKKIFYAILRVITIPLRRFL
ncbi:phospholipase D family protein [Ruminococcus sp. OM04-4AA]|uniref:phospholipase D family protein n=1 Tax=Mediterraneibacter faecis TaxID=592978 RepID=UPI000E4C95F4|nr:phospholipase D family protein [Mediterraneibacter faecis]RGI48145.1 phospholipase D family protein [Ruminococcus sp. OM04-4AA]